MHEASFSPEQIELFRYCNKNGYNLFIDTDYVSWLLVYHPEDIPADTMAGVSDPSLPFPATNISVYNEDNTALGGEVAST